MHVQNGAIFRVAANAVSASPRLPWENEDAVRRASAGAPLGSRAGGALPAIRARSLIECMPRPCISSQGPDAATLNITVHFNFTETKPRRHGGGGAEPRGAPSQLAGV